MLSGANLTSPRASFLVTRNLLVRGEWKFARGRTAMIEAAWGGPHYPNATTAVDPISNHSFKCPARGCLYNVWRDPSETDKSPDVGGLNNGTRADHRIICCYSTHAFGPRVGTATTAPP